MPSAPPASAGQGRDFTPENEAFLTRRGIDTIAIEHADGLSFHWTGSYTGAMNEGTTLGTDLNVFADFSPKIPAAYGDTDFLFLANIDPVLQLRPSRHASPAQFAAKFAIMTDRALISAAIKAKLQSSLASTLATAWACARQASHAHAPLC